MRKLLITLATLLALTCAWAASVTLTIDEAAIVPIRTACEDYRNLKNYRASGGPRALTDEDCVFLFTKLGAIAAREEVARGAARQQASSNAATARNIIEAVMPQPAGVVVMFCGDGITDNDTAAEYVEECDDGNTLGGDGCSAACQDE